MRASFFLVASAALLVGCGPGADPALGPCAARKPAELYLGTGADRFEPIRDTIEVQLGPPGQGGGSMHIWFAMRCRNMGPHVVAEIGVDDLTTGDLLTPISLREAIDLEYNPDQQADEVYGIRGFLEGFSDIPAVKTGDMVKLWVKMDDDCKAHEEAEAVTTVSGFHQL